MSIDKIYEALFERFDNLPDDSKYPRLYEAALDVIVELLGEATKENYDKAAKMVESEAKKAYALLSLCGVALDKKREKK